MRIAMAGMIVMSMGMAAAPPPPPPDVSVAARDGVYHVTATFVVTQPASIAFAVLTDYEQIPRFMPDVRKSRILERRHGDAGSETTVVEQEAIAHVMLFSKRVHLVLEIEETPNESIHFRDRRRESFESYEGAWTITETTGRAEIAYTLTAKPNFDVPEFLLKRLLKRDAQTMIEQLKTEFTRRAVVAATPPETR